MGAGEEGEHHAEEGTDVGRDVGGGAEAGQGVDAGGDDPTEQDQAQFGVPPEYRDHSVVVPNEGEVVGVLGVVVDVEVVVVSVVLGRSVSACSSRAAT